AVELMSIGLDKLREHLRPTYRAHRTITIGGIQPTIIPDLAQIWWYVRDASGPWAKENYDKLINIGRGAALMTGTTMDAEVVASAWPQLSNRALAEVIQRNIDAVGMPQWSEAEVKFAREFEAAAGQRPRASFRRRRASRRRVSIRACARWAAGRRPTRQTTTATSRGTCRASSSIFPPRYRASRRTTGRPAQRPRPPPPSSPRPSRCRKRARSSLSRLRTRATSRCSRQTRSRRSR